MRTLYSEISGIDTEITKKVVWILLEKIEASDLSLLVNLKETYEDLLGKTGN